MKVADPELMRAINRYHVMDAIRRWGPISRTEICAKTDLSSTTVSAITATLLDDELVIPRSDGSIRNLGRGRPRVMLDINPDAARVVGVKIAPHGIVLVVANFKGEELASVSIPIRVDRQTAAVVTDLIEDGVKRCVADAGVWLRDVKSLCVALPGVIEHAAGFVRTSPVLNETNIPLGEILTRRLDLPVTVESAANAAAVAEHWHRECCDLDDFIVVSIERSVDIGVMHAGQLFRGTRGMSFDAGSMVVTVCEADPSQLRRVDAYAPHNLVLETLGRHPEHLRIFGQGRGMEHVRSLIEAGNNDLKGAVEQSAEVLGRVIANIVALFAPPRIVLMGRALVLGGYLLEPLQRSLSRAVPESLGDVSQIVVDDIDDTDWARGAAGAALRDLYGSPWSTTGPVPVRGG
jgi:predicted NBD/HSP70 family sugar kinase